MPEIGPLVGVAEFKDSEWTCEELREETGLERVPLPLCDQTHLQLGRTKILSLRFSQSKLLLKSDPFPSSAKPGL